MTLTEFATLNSVADFARANPVIFQDGYIYLACPYSGSAADRHQRSVYAEMATRDLLEANLSVFSPLTHSHTLVEKYQLPQTWDFWKQIDLPLVKGSNVLFVLMLDGWEQSVGVAAEVEHANANGIPCFGIDWCKGELVVFGRIQSEKEIAA